MGKKNNKDLKKLYLQKEREKDLEKLANSNDPVMKLLFTPPKKEITEEFILTTPGEELRIELCKKINEETDELRKIHRKQEEEAQMMLHSCKRMVLFTSIFEDMVTVGDADKFFYGTASSQMEIEETINGYLLINELKLAKLLIAAKENHQLVNKIEAYFEDEKKVEKIQQERTKFIRQHAKDFTYQ